MVPALAGAICVNFAIPFASYFVELINLTNPMMPSGGWAFVRGRLGSSHPQETREGIDEGNAGCPVGLHRERSPMPADRHSQRSILSVRPLLISLRSITRTARYPL